MNLVTQESGPQKGTDSQTGILKGHPERFCVLICACEARGVAGIKAPDYAGAGLFVGFSLSALTARKVVINCMIVFFPGIPFLIRVFGDEH